MTLSMRMRTHPTSTLPERKGKRGEGRGVSDEYGVRDAACPISTGVQHGAHRPSRKTLKRSAHMTGCPSARADQAQTTGKPSSPNGASILSDRAPCAMVPGSPRDQRQPRGPVDAAEFGRARARAGGGRGATSLRTTSRSRASARACRAPPAPAPRRAPLPRRGNVRRAPALIASPLRRHHALFVVRIVAEWPCTALLASSLGAPKASAMRQGMENARMTRANDIGRRYLRSRARLPGTAPLGHSRGRLHAAPGQGRAFLLLSKLFSSAAASKWTVKSQYPAS